MKIGDIRLTPLHCAFKPPYRRPQGVAHGAPVILVDIETGVHIGNW